MSTGVADLAQRELALLRDRLRAQGASAPRIGLLLLAHRSDVAAVAAALARLPGAVAELFDEVVVFATEADSAELGRRVPPALATRVAIKSDPRRYGYGGRRKIALEYALEHALDFALVCDAAADLPLEHAPRLLLAALEPDAPIVIGSRQSGARPSSARAAHNALLGLGLSDWASGLRVLARQWLVRLPFQLDADDRRFDTELLIQARAAGARIVEVEVPAFADGEAFSIGASLLAALDYRLHQLHVTRRGQFLVEADARYLFKRSPHGSHMQVLDAIAQSARVLDLGCSQGLLAGPLLAKAVRVVGVDAGPPERVSKDLEAYYQRDLEQPLYLPEGRAFDYVVVSDVIEHIQNRTRLLRSVRRHLRPDGRLLISTPNIAIWFYRLSLLVGRFEYGPRGVLDETHVHLFTRATFRREVERAGFRVLKERVTALPFELVFESTGQSRAVRALSSAYHALARLWPELFAYQFVLEAEVTTLHDPLHPNDDE